MYLYGYNQTTHQYNTYEVYIIMDNLDIGIFDLVVIYNYIYYLTVVYIVIYEPRLYLRVWI